MAIELNRVLSLKTCERSQSLADVANEIGDAAGFWRLDGNEPPMIQEGWKRLYLLVHEETITSCNQRMKKIKSPKLQ